MVDDYIFENINSVYDDLIKTGWSISKVYHGNAPYEMVDYGNNKFVYYPQPTGVPFFRGQSKFYDSCLASYYRFQPDGIEEFILDLKFEEFKNIISKHPYIKNEIENNLHIDFVALAQHYELKTKMLDITNSLAVAAFFAVTRKDNNGYMPVERSEIPGVLYFIDPMLEHSFDSPIHPVGWQVFKRPGEQRAFGLDLSNKKDLNTMSGVFAYRFWQDGKISKQLFDLFEGGEMLFPKDEFGEKASKIKDSNTFSQSAFDTVFENKRLNLSKELILVELAKRNIRINEISVLEYSKEDISVLNKALESGELTTNLNVTTRLCYFPDSED